MGRFEEKQGRVRLVCLHRDSEKVLNHIKTLHVLKIVGTYKKGLWTHIIVDSSIVLNYDFVENFQSQVDRCLGAFEDYDIKFD